MKKLELEFSIKKSPKSSYNYNSLHSLESIDKVVNYNNNNDTDYGYDNDNDNDVCY
jgi:hypothetical protein